MNRVGTLFPFPLHCRRRDLTSLFPPSCLILLCSMPMGGIFDYHGDHSEAARDTKGIKREQRSGCHTGYDGETQTAAEEFGVSIMCGKEVCDVLF